ncbi:MAG: hypothetical protein R3335_13010, partial [Anaerolineales bacterium]|nr:hypothetical protein [Anaerolineales bacterium]
LASQRQMLIRRGEDPDSQDDAVMAGLFEKHMAQTDAWIGSQPNIRSLDISYNDLVQDPAPYVDSLNDFLGGRLDMAAMAAIIDPSLYRQRN